MFFKLNRWKKAITLLLILGLFLGMNTLLLPWTVSAATGSITVKVDGEECKIFTPEELEELQEEEYYTYSTINTWPTKSWYIGEGPTLADLLEEVEMPEGFQLEDIRQIKIKSSDGLQLTFTKKELLDDTRYYFPGLKENHEYFGYISGSPEGAVEVPTVLALLSIDSDDSADLGGRDKNAPHLLFGQRWITEQTNQAFVKTVSEIDLLTDEPKKWDNPTATPKPGIVPVGTKVRLSCEFNDADKVYYTVDDSDPTYESPMYNWVAARWWNNRKDELDEINKPIEINENTVIKAVTIGNGKADSDIVTLKYLVPGVTRYVDGSGSADFTTIQEAVTAADEGDIIIIKDGTYTENVVVDKGLVIQSENGAESTIVQAAAANADVFKVTAENVTIDGFTVSGATSMGKAGILVMGSSSGFCLIKNNKCSGNNRGISLEVTKDNTISNNICTLSGNYGIYLANTTGNSIIDNNCSSNTSGAPYAYALYLADKANNNTVSGNIVDTNLCGIRVKAAHTNTIFNNTISNNDTGLELATRSEGNLFYLNNFVDNTIGLSEGTLAVAGNFWNSPAEMEYMLNGTQYSSFLGNYWDDYTGVDADGNGIGDTAYQTIQTDSDDYPLMGQWDDGTITVIKTTWYVDGSGGADFTTIQEAVTAVDTGNTIIVKDGTYTENLVVDKSLVIQSENGAESTIVQAAAANADVFKVTAENVTIDGFTVSGATSMGKAGILVMGSSSGSCLIKNNKCSGNNRGISLEVTKDNTISNNICTLSGNYGIYLANTTGNSIIDNNCSSNTAGAPYAYALYLADKANNNTVSGNIVDTNLCGIRVKAAHTNTIFNNTISNNDTGLELATRSEGNLFYLNNFVDNTIGLSEGTLAVAGNFWNSPAEMEYMLNGTQYSSFLGNYWDDYTGVDADGNGIGDTAYQTIQTDSDDYPLMGQWDNDTITIEKIPVTELSYKVEPIEDDVYTIGETEDGITTMTVNDNQTGLSYFAVAIEAVEPHEGTETVIFAHIRNGVQLQLNALEADFDRVSAAKAGFNIRPGDVVKVYIVDRLTNDSDLNPIVLQ